MKLDGAQRLKIIILVLRLKDILRNKGKQNKEKQLNRFFAGAFAIVSLFYSTFVFTYGMAYRGYTLDQKMDLNKGEISVEELEKATLYLIEQVNQWGRREISSLQ